MDKSFDLLSTVEKSFMLVALLFSRKKLDEILFYLPEESQKKIKEVVPIFLFLSQSDRVTKIIKELKKLFSLSSNKIDLDQEKIFYMLEQEPEYLKKFIKNCLDNRENFNNKFTNLVLEKFYKRSIS